MSDSEKTNSSKPLPSPKKPERIHTPDELRDAFKSLRNRLPRCMNADRFRFRNLIDTQIQKIDKASDVGKLNISEIAGRLGELREQVNSSVDRRTARKNQIPKITYDDNLPVSQRRDEIRQTIADNQVVIICGETGSGKSTQIPKILLEMGLAEGGIIGHTQPRRIAARSIATRVAEELGTTVGKLVGFKIRFTDSTSDQTYIKLMTDGILLAETQRDRLLDQYSVLIIDEAHERSLNIDFLLGYIKRILSRRRDLKVIITSATINAELFAQHFGTYSPDGFAPAPIITVSGRTYPVDIRYQPIEDEDDDSDDETDRFWSEKTSNRGAGNNSKNNSSRNGSDRNSSRRGDDIDWQRGAVKAVAQLCQQGPGDILVFMPTEYDIHETAKLLRSQKLDFADPDILPLYARLSAAEQQKIFQSSSRRKIVIATNVAESSITVPGIRYVVDPGTARMSRYSARTRTQRLPVEAISQASADQRAGRCGRVGPGICVRLYSERDYQSRDKYTTPEIQRTNLASVILQTIALRLGAIEKFPFIDPPRLAAIRDGYGTLLELGAIDDKQQITQLGRRLAQLPVDPRIARMVLAAQEEDCLGDVLVIAAALELQDPRERPVEKAGEADAAHLKFVDNQSDFLSYLKLWDFYQHLKDTVSQNQLRKACRQNFLSYNRLREWSDIYRQLRDLLGETKPPKRTDDFDRIHRSILSGLLSSIGHRVNGTEYQSSGGKFVLWPGSGLRKSEPINVNNEKNEPNKGKESGKETGKETGKEAGKEAGKGRPDNRLTESAPRPALPDWLVAGEMVETSKRYLRTVGRINPEWVEPMAEHLVKRTYADPHWERKGGSAVAFENVSLFGLPIVSRRKVRFGKIDPAASRELLIQSGLVEGDIDCKLDFYVKNQKLQEELERLQSKMRRHDFMQGDWKRFEFYDQRIPADVYDLVTLAQWVKTPGNNRLLTMTESDLATDAVPPGDLKLLFPDTFQGTRLNIPIEYKFQPGDADDGISLQVPSHAVCQISQSEVDWGVPGLLTQKIAALIKSLPKELRRPLVPAPDTAKWVAGQLTFGQGDFLAEVARQLSRRSGQGILPSQFNLNEVDDGLKLNIQAVDSAGEIIAQSRDLNQLMDQLGEKTVEELESYTDPRWTQTGLTGWTFGDLPESVPVKRQRATIHAFPMIVDAETSVSLELGESLAKAEDQTRRGIIRLVQIANKRDLKTQAQWLPGLSKMQINSASLRGFKLSDAISDFIAARAIPDRFWTDPLVRSEARFWGLVKQVRERIGLAVQDAAALFPPLWECYHAAAFARDNCRNPALRYAIDDIGQQMDELFKPGFLIDVPYEWLRQYPRYLKGIVQRLDALQGNALVRDRQATETIQGFWSLYEQGIRDAHVRGVANDELTIFRWMIEEFRVSCFAQKLGTHVSVSEKRLEKQWEKVVK